jgi:hypothetical protein
MLVALFLLTSAATAYAECAWVLWSRITGLDQQRGTYESQSWTITAAFPTYQTCAPRQQSELRRVKQMLLEKQDWRVRENNETVTGVLEREGRLDSLMFWFNCLPDTVDPRGPKTK